MNKKFLISLLVALLIIVIGAALFFYGRGLIPNALAPDQSATITIQDKQINDDTKPLVIKITYPSISGLNDFNKRAKDIIDKEITDFKTNF